MQAIERSLNTIQQLTLDAPVAIVTLLEDALWCGEWVKLT
jgi:hypothetical protein